jgi:cellobiose-specific phosphotransferase system component IIC
MKRMTKEPKIAVLTQLPVNVRKFATGRLPVRLVTAMVPAIANPFATQTSARPAMAMATAWSAAAIRIRDAAMDNATIRRTVSIATTLPRAYGFPASLHGARPAMVMAIVWFATTTQISLVALGAAATRKNAKNVTILVPGCARFATTTRT